MTGAQPTVLRTCWQVWGIRLFLVLIGLVAFPPLAVFILGLTSPDTLDAMWAASPNTLTFKFLHFTSYFMLRPLARLADMYLEAPFVWVLLVAVPCLFLIAYVDYGIRVRRLKVSTLASILLSWLGYSWLGQ